MKPYYETPLGKLYHGDCLTIMPELEPVDLVLTDPPYGINWNCDYSGWINPNPPSSKTFRHKSQRTYPSVYGDDKPFDPSHLLGFKNVIVWGATCFLKYLGSGSLLVWHKRMSENFLSQAEVAWMNRGYGAYVYTQSVESMGNVRTHPTQKPVGLIVWCIEKSKTEGVIMDPYLGSGTTAVACESLNRRWIGIEISEQYCEISAKRIEQERAQRKLFT